MDNSILLLFYFSLDCKLKLKWRLSESSFLLSKGYIKCLNRSRFTLFFSLINKTLNIFECSHRKLRFNGRNRVYFLISTNLKSSLLRVNRFFLYSDIIPYNNLQIPFKPYLLRLSRRIAPGLCLVGSSSSFRFLYFPRRAFTLCCVALRIREHGLTRCYQQRISYLRGIVYGMGVR